MKSFKKRVHEFLNLKTIAVAGISGKNGDNPGNHIFKKLKESGYTVFAVNPSYKEIDGQPCYPDIFSTPSKVEGVVIVTNPNTTQQILRECVHCGVKYVWMHQLLIGLKRQ